ncbi:MAG: hypothetical protein KIS66_10920 [Fimbriimonadaceae bacterium]|nr:hypothetical protein [Fimbriimonadaceae bacterium]
MRIDANPTPATSRESAPVANVRASVQLRMLKASLDAQKAQAERIANELEGKGQLIDIEA